MSPNALQQLVFGIITLQMMQDTDQRGGVVGLVCVEIFNVPQMQVRSFKQAVQL
ncbi:hypothetical protein D3C85_1773820 [compost metagenome]